MNCPLCNIQLKAAPPRDKTGGADWFNCERCGNFGLTETALSLWNGQSRDDQARAVLSHFVRRARMGDECPLVDSNVLSRVLDEDYLPSPNDLVNNLLLFIGDQSYPGASALFSIQEHGAIIGAINDKGFYFAIHSLENLELARIESANRGILGLSLTLTGWSKYDALKKGTHAGNKAFMAMKFGNDDLDKMFNSYFRPAVSATGFTLMRLDDEPRAGLIDDRLRVEIQTSKFLIADLTYGNNGAYWEAGYAEGLGKSVIYTCSQEHFDEAGTHFDTNHHLTVIWDKTNPQGAVDQLKATIRATIPEAKMEELIV